MLSKKEIKANKIVATIWDTALDDQVCEACASLHNRIFPIHSRELKKLEPPIHKGCRCRLRYITQEERGIKERLKEYGPVDFRKLKKGMGRKRVIQGDGQGRKKVKKGKGCLIGLGLVFLLLIVIGIIASISEDEKKPTKVETRIQKETKEIKTEAEKPSLIAKTEEEKPIVLEKEVTIPKHIILKEDVVDSPAKTQVTLEALVSGEISTPGLRILLDQLYSSTKAKKGFKYHDSPTSIYIYAYTSKERAESGMGQWIAMLQKAHAETSPTININERQISQLGVEPEERFGLSEEKRKEIWKELILIEDRAMEEALERYPQELEKQIEMERRLIDENENKLAEKYELTPDQLGKISTEGLEKDWPFPRKSE